MEVSHEVSQFLAMYGPSHRRHLWVTSPQSWRTRSAITPDSFHTRPSLHNEGHIRPRRRAHIMATILLTIDQVASRMQISRTSVYRLIATGQLDVVKIMGSTRISEHALEDTIAHHTSFGTAVSR